MKTIGLIGGLAWPSTVEYYRMLCRRTAAYFEARGASAPLPTPHMVIESVNIAATRRLRGQEGDEASWAAYDEFFRALFRRLAAAGAAFGAMASNTPHMRLHAIRQGLDFPIVSILEATAEATRARGARRALVLGTPVTMASDAYARALAARGIEALPRPAPARIAALEHVIDVDLYQGRVGESRAFLLDLAREAGATPDDAVLLACTELPLAFPGREEDAAFASDGLSFVNTTAAHVEAILAATLSDDA